MKNLFDSAPWRRATRRRTAAARHAIPLSSRIRPSCCGRKRDGPASRRHMLNLSSVGAFVLADRPVVRVATWLRLDEPQPDGLGQGEHRAPAGAAGSAGLRRALPLRLVYTATQEALSSSRPSWESVGGAHRNSPTVIGGRRRHPSAHPPPRCYPRHITTQAIPIGQTARRIDYFQSDLTTPHIRSRVQAKHLEVPTPRPESGPVRASPLSPLIHRRRCEPSSRILSAGVPDEPPLARRPAATQCMEECGLDGQNYVRGSRGRISDGFVICGRSRSPPHRRARTRSRRASRRRR